MATTTTAAAADLGGSTMAIMTPDSPAKIIPAYLPAYQRLRGFTRTYGDLQRVNWQSCLVSELS
jgi:hypothetical protein